MSASATDMRSELLASALHILRAEGAAALTVRRTAERAGCSTTGIYTHFGGKHGLVEAIFLDGFESFDRTLGPAYARDDLTAAAIEYRRWALANRTHYLVMFGQAVPDYSPSPAAEDRGRASFQLIVDAVARAGAADPQRTAYHVWATAHGYVMLELVGMLPFDIDDPEQWYMEGILGAGISLFV
jgi:AcrR family transcriptional regulator